MNKTWLKIWIGIGAVASAAVLVLPPYLTYVASEDVKRYRECVAGTRSDCERTIVWNLVDAAIIFQQQSGASLAGTIYEGLDPASPSGAVRTSENAPHIEKVEPQGMSNANGTYYATAGSKITFRTTLRGNITSADLYVVSVVDGEIQRPEKVAPLIRVEGEEWEAEYVLSPGFVGSIEVRAYGADPKDLAVLALPVAAR